MLPFYIAGQTHAQSQLHSPLVPHQKKECQMSKDHSHSLFLGARETVYVARKEATLQLAKPG